MQQKVNVLSITFDYSNSPPASKITCVMKRIIALLFTLTFFSTLVSSQNSSKLNFSLQRKLKATRLISREIALFVQGDVKEIRRKTEEVGGRFKYSAGNIAAINIRLDQVNEIAGLKSVVRIENNDLKLQPMNDQVLINNHVSEVHLGFDLPQGYDGTGVVIGIIDDGIDYKHPDFKDVNGNTRIKYVWDQTSGLTSISPAPYGFGREWIGSQIDTSTNFTDGATSHGSHVTGTACGNGLAVNNYKGVAPNADIIVVKIDFGETDDNLLTNLGDAVKYIYDKANALGEPAVINASLGTYFGSHDAKDIQAIIIDNLITEQAGRSFVCAAGNAGATLIHLGYDVSTDTLFTWLRYPGGPNNPIYIELWGDSADFANVQFAIGIDRIQPGYSYLSGLPFSGVQNHFIYQSDALWSGGNRLGIVESLGDYLHGAYQMQFLITPDSTSASYAWRLMTKGSGHFDAWSFNMVFDNLPDSTVFPLITKYKKPDLEQTIASSFTCSDKVITVGSYVNRNRYANSISAQTVDTLLHPGALSLSSSHGPTRDGRIKPDINATGEWVLSCGASPFIINLAASFDYYKVAAGKKHFRSTGTSMSSPVVAGVAALYLQKNPTATYAEVKDAILSCADADQFTGFALPDNKWGYGKINAYNTVHGCAVGIHENNFSAVELTNFPNPFEDHTVIQYDLSALSKYKNAVLKFFDMPGHEVWSFRLNDRSNNVVVSKNNLGSGLYFYSVEVDGKILKTNKLVVL